MTNRPNLSPAPSASSWPALPPAVIMCRHCQAETNEADPPGWETDNLTRWLRMSFRHGVCPGCRRGSAPPGRG